MKKLLALAGCLVFLCSAVQAQIQLEPEAFIVNPEALGPEHGTGGDDDGDNKMALYNNAAWPGVPYSIIAYSTEDISFSNVVHIKLTGLGLDPSRSYGLKANMVYPADWDYSYTSAADAVGEAKLTLSKDDGEMEDVLLDGDGNISIYIGDLSGSVGFCSIDTFTLTVGPVVDATLAGVVIILR